MYELHLVAYLKVNKITMINGKIHTAQKACGVGGIIGNKGGIQMHFNLNDKTYNFIGVHLLHGQNNREGRDEMMATILQNLNSERQEMDPDILCDYNFILGDMNYRFESTYEDMIDTDKIKNSP